MNIIVRSAMVFLLFGCSPQVSQWQKVPLPSFQEPVVLRVVYADNPRFAPLSSHDLALLLEHARSACQTYLDTRVTFELLPPIGIETLFSRLKPEVLRARRAEIYDIRHGGGKKEQLVTAMVKGLQERHTPLNEMIAYASPHLLHPPKTPTLPAFAESLADTLIDRIALWKALKAPDGLPAIDDTPYNEWTYWDSLGYTALSFDIVITNTLIASVEYYGQDIHSALRGGLTVGTTTNAHASQLGAFIFWSTFAFTDRNELLERLRGGEHYDTDKAMELSGTYLAHEIGHLLFHYGHPFESDACIMAPVPMLHFKEWAQKLDKKRCDEGNFPAMKRGAAAIYYNSGW